MTVGNMNYSYTMLLHLQLGGTWCISQQLLLSATYDGCGLQPVVIDCVNKQSVAVEVTSMRSGQSFNNGQQAETPLNPLKGFI